MLPDFRKLSQKGYISLVLIVFALLMAALIFPFKFPTLQSVGLQYSGSIPITTNGCQRPTGAVYELREKGYSVDTKADESEDYGPSLGSGIATYKQVLKDVPVLTEYLNNNINIDGYGSLDKKAIVIKFLPDRLREIGNQKYYLLYPRKHGVVDLSEGNQGESLKYSPASHGIIFLAHTDAGLNPITIPGQVFGYDKGNFLLTDVYQEESLISSEPIPDVVIAECQGLNRGPKRKPDEDVIPPGVNIPQATDSAVIIPSQKTSSDKHQIQLEWFLIQGNQSGTIAGAWSTHCKPAIYLYPPKKELVNVKVHPSGFLTYVDPPYNQSKGWTIWAGPDGKLQTINDSRFTIYEYLYFESKIKDEVIRKPEKGWVVKFDELENLYQNILPKLGLNAGQTKDFIEYWKKALPEAPYYFVGIIDQANVDLIERLEITPKPDSVLRVRIYFERLDFPNIVQVPDLPSIENLKFEILNSRFRVVEWGGMVKNDPDHPFTCSQ